MLGNGMLILALIYFPRLRKKKKRRVQNDLLSGMKKQAMKYFFDNVVLHVREGYVVMLAKQMCSCGKWNKTGISCQHAMTAITYKGGDQLNYVSEGSKWMYTQKHINLL